MKTIITFIIVFGILVLVHEFGHFYFAKRAGILVREFAIGMGPKIFAHRGKDGTTYTIRLLPIGGYVRMAGMGEDMTEITPGMPLSVELNAVGNVVKINTSKKVQLPHSIPMEVVDFDLEKNYSSRAMSMETRKKKPFIKLTMMQRLLKVMEPRCGLRHLTFNFNQRNYRNAF